MRWIARVLVFTAALNVGMFGAFLFSTSAGGGLSNCTFSLKPSSAQQPDGVRLMYAGWQYESDDRVASLKFVLYNGLNMPVTYRGYTSTDALPEVRVNGEKFERGRCLFGVKDFEIAPGRSAEVRADRWEFPRGTFPDARVTVGIYLYLPDSERPNILAVSEPFALPEEFRTVKLP